VIHTGAVVTLASALLLSVGVSLFCFVSFIAESQVQYLQRMNLAH
jgi:hypothetical protein